MLGASGGSPAAGRHSQSQPSHQSGWPTQVQISTRDYKLDPIRRQVAQLRRAAARPLDHADMSTPEERGQLSLLEGFNGECQGVCGV
jgi:hypothetical protein